MYCRPFCPDAAVYDPPRRIYRDICHPQRVHVIHPIEIVNRHHCIPVYHHRYVYSVRDQVGPYGPVGGTQGVRGAQDIRRSHGFHKSHGLKKLR
ncbi:hypothetical protein IJ21_20980 [Paenibacillus sp. 32O-W]|nr:hypothetical protein IJ21_20980 [Paenibacillus sp. 32O-W]